MNINQRQRIELRDILRMVALTKVVDEKTSVVAQRLLDELCKVRRILIEPARL